MKFTYQLIFFLSLLLVACTDDDESNGSSTGGDNNVDIPSVALVCYKSSASGCDNTGSADGAYVWIVLRNSSSNAVVAQSMVALSCNSTQCSATATSWVNSSEQNITQIPNSTYDKLAVLDLDNDVSSVDYSAMDTDGRESGIDARCAKEDQNIGTQTNSVGLETCQMTP